MATLLQVYNTQSIFYLIDKNTSVLDELKKSGRLSWRKGNPISPIDIVEELSTLIDNLGYELTLKQESIQSYFGFGEMEKDYD